MSVEYEFGFWYSVVNEIKIVGGGNVKHIVQDKKSSSSKVVNGFVLKSAI